MRKIKCPLCKGKGVLFLKKFKFRIECPACLGRGWIWELDLDDIVTVEEIDIVIPPYKHYIIHHKDALRGNVRRFDMKLRDALKKDDVYLCDLCDMCFGRVVKIGKRLVKTNEELGDLEW